VYILPQVSLSSFPTERQHARISRGLSAHGVVYLGLYSISTGARSTTPHRRGMASHFFSRMAKNCRCVKKEQQSACIALESAQEAQVHASVLRLERSIASMLSIYFHSGREAWQISHASREERDERCYQRVHETWMRAIERSSLQPRAGILVVLVRPSRANFQMSCGEEDQILQ
jgi:hypothetical protein